MPHAIFLCLQIATVVFVWFNDDGHIAYNLKSVSLKSDAFHRIVRDESNLCHTQTAQYLCAYAIIAFVRTESQVDVRIHSVVALFLQFVGGYFIHQTDAAPFLIEVHDYAFALCLNEVHRLVQLFAAIATLASKDIARHATRMHPYQNGFVLFPFAFEQGHMFQSITFLTEGNNAEMSVFRRHIGFHALFHQRFALQTIADEIFYGARLS